ncbi:hypothetical protein AAMO2058_000834800 [Amorphochlora amoebiformis]
MNCPKCDAWVRRKEEIEDHKAAVCPTTTVPCILKCGRQFKRKDLKERMEHLLRCKLWVVHCPTCGGSLPLSEWDSHTKTCKPVPDIKERKQKGKELSDKKSERGSNGGRETKMQAYRRWSLCEKCSCKILSYDVSKTLCLSCFEEKRNTERRRDELFQSLSRSGGASIAAGTVPPWELMAGMTAEEQREQLEKIAAGMSGVGGDLGGLTGLTNLGSHPGMGSFGPTVPRRASADMSPEELRAMLNQVTYDSLIYKDGNTATPSASAMPTSSPTPSYTRARASDAWWVARNGGAEGLVPSNYFDMLEDAAPLGAQDTIPEEQEDEEIEIPIPEGAYPGATLTINVDGDQIQVEVPEGMHPGEILFVRLPRSSPPQPTSPDKKTAGNIGQPNSPSYEPAGAYGPGAHSTGAEETQKDFHPASEEERVAFETFKSLSEGRDRDTGHANKDVYVDVWGLKGFLKYEDVEAAGFIERATLNGSVPRDGKAPLNTFITLITGLLKQQKTDKARLKIKGLLESYIEFRDFKMAADRKSSYGDKVKEAKERLKQEEEKKIAAEKERLKREEEERRITIEKERMKRRKIAAEKERIQLELEERRLLAQKERLQREQEERLAAEKERLQREQEERLAAEKERIQREQEERRLAAEKEQLQREQEKRRLATERERLQREQEERRLASRKRLQREQAERRLAAEEERLKLKEKRRRLEAEKERLKRQEERRRIAAEMEQLKLDEERRKLAAEKERLKREKEEREQIEAEKEVKRLEEEERKKIEAENERRKHEEEKKRIEAEKERLKHEEEKKRIEAEKERLKHEEEKKRIEAEKERSQRQEEERLRIEAEKLAREAAERAAREEAMIREREKVEQEKRAFERQQVEEQKLRRKAQKAAEAQKREESKRQQFLERRKAEEHRMAAAAAKRKQEERVRLQLAERLKRIRTKREAEDKRKKEQILLAKKQREQHRLKETQNSLPVLGVGSNVEVYFRKWGWTPVVVKRVYTDDEGEWALCESSAGAKKEVRTNDSSVIRLPSQGPSTSGVEPQREPRKSPSQGSGSTLTQTGLFKTPTKPTSTMEPMPAASPPTANPNLSAPRTQNRVRTHNQRKNAPESRVGIQTKEKSQRSRARILAQRQREDKKRRQTKASGGRNVKRTARSKYPRETRGKRGQAAQARRVTNKDQKGEVEENGFVIIHQPNPARSRHGTPGKLSTSTLRAPRRTHLRREGKSPQPPGAGREYLYVRLQFAARKAMERGENMEAERLFKAAIKAAEREAPSRRNSGVLNDVSTVVSATARSICRISLWGFSRPDN